MQYEQQADGTMTPLPKPSIDTGAGLERVLSVLQGVDSVYELDEIRHLISVAEGLCSTTYGTGDPSDVSLRIVAEHARTMTFLISDGVFPSNEDRGYVLRRIIRRAIRHAYLLGVETVVLPSMVDAVVATMADDYPELAASHAYVREVVEREEVRFRETLRTGSVILSDALDEVAAMGAGARLAGSVAFQLHDTYGFPLEVTEEVAAERGIGVDRVAFDDEMSAQRQRGRDARKAIGQHADASTFAALLDDAGPTEFTGREEDSSAATVARRARRLDRAGPHALLRRVGRSGRRHRGDRDRHGPRHRRRHRLRGAGPRPAT